MKCLLLYSNDNLSFKIELFPFKYCIYYTFIFLPDLPTPKTTSAAPLHTTTAGDTQSTHQHVVTTQPHDSCSQNITVVYPASSFCTDKRDGVYVRSKSPQTFYKCLRRKTFLTKCHVLVPQQSSAVTVTSSRDLNMLSCVFVTLFYLLSVCVNR